MATLVGELKGGMMNTFFLSIMFSVLFVVNLYADSRISVDLDPSTPETYELDKTILTIGDTIDFDIVAIDVMNLDSYDFKLLYSSAILDVKISWITDGPFLSSLGGMVFFFRELLPDTIWVSNSLSGTDTALAPDGSGVICRIRCIAKTDGESDLIFADAFFIDSYGDVTHVTEGAGNGRITVVPPGICEKGKTPFSGSSLCLENYPNPFSTKTVIRARLFRQLTDSYQHESPARATITIHDIAGRLIRSFPINQLTNQPINQITWDGTDNQGRKVSSGIYFYRLEVGDFTVTKKAVVLK